MKMLRIKLLSNVFGAWRGRSGDEVERPEPEAQRLIRGGFAVLVEAPAAAAPQQESTAEVNNGQ